MNDISQSISDTVCRIVDQYKNNPGSLLPILHAIQSEFGYIPQESVAVIAKALKQTSAEITGVISFYHHFRTSPGGRHSIQICRAEACQARGSRDLENHVQAKLGIHFGETSKDGEIDLDAVYCLGNCACGPSLRVDDQIMGRVSPDSFDQLLEQLQTQLLEVK